MVLTYDAIPNVFTHCFVCLFIYFVLGENASELAEELVDYGFINKVGESGQQKCYPLTSSNPGVTSGYKFPSLSKSLYLSGCLAAFFFF